MRSSYRYSLALTVFALAACSSPGDDTRAASSVHADTRAAAVIYKDPAQPVAARVEDLLARMSLDDKLGQMTQPDRGYRDPRLPPSVVTELRIGSMLSGGDSGPEPSTPEAWADMYDSYQRAALATPLGIPLLYAVDAVHGHNNVHGATVFPHNIGLGAARDPELGERIGRAAAEEIAGTGLDWTFAPCVAVTRDDHWGRVYESFGETPEWPVAMTSLITGLQGASLGATPTSIMATAKHYVGDGGTLGGDDQGNTVLSEQELRDVHLPPFKAAVARGVGAIMASYSSFNGQKMHGHKYLISDVLKGELGFKGLVVTDWDGIELLDGAYGFSPEDVRTSVNAGVDVFMITEQFRYFLSLLRAEVQAGRVSMARIDDANRRILTKKFELGLFERPLADRSYLGTVGSPEHRAVAREAVQKSQVVLKNDGVLPIARDAKIFVAGKSADNIGFQSGGWTMKWQGGDGPITLGTTILGGFRNTVQAGGTVTYDKEGNGVDGTYDVAVAIVGEKPYAEYEGDREDDLTLDATDLAALAKLEASGVPVVTVIVSGRPLDVHAHVGKWKGLVASWLPGTEGQGVADVLFGAVKPTGKLPVSWLRDVSQEPINVGDGKTPLFPYGFGLTYDATIEPPVEPPPTNPGRDARSTIRAESYTTQSGTELEDCTDEGCGRSLGYIGPGDSLAYDDVDFGAASPARVAVRVAAEAGSGSIEFRLDAATGPVVATLPMTPTGGWTNWATRTAPLAAAATGKHRLFVVFQGPGGDFVNVNWFRFQD